MDAPRIGGPVLVDPKPLIAADGHCWEGRPPGADDPTKGFCLGWGRPIVSPLPRKIRNLLFHLEAR